MKRFAVLLMDHIGADGAPLEVLVAAHYWSIDESGVLSFWTTTEWATSSKTSAFGRHAWLSVEEKKNAVDS